MSTKIFVYGTLVGTRQDATPAKLKNAEKHTDGTYPTITVNKGSTVKGEVIEVNGTELRRLDMIESEGSLYHRTPINRNESVQAYIGNPSQLGTEADYQFNKAQLAEDFKNKTELEILD